MLKSGDFKSNINPDSLKVITAKIEPSVKSAKPMDKFQFQRLGYFCVDRIQMITNWFLTERLH